MKLFKLLSFDEKGGGVVEYALIVGLLALAAITAITTVGNKVSTKMTSISNTV